jgi:hypothetical protein
LHHHREGDQIVTVLLTKLKVKEMLEKLAQYGLDGELDTYEMMDASQQGPVRKLVWTCRSSDETDELIQLIERLAAEFSSPLNR